MRPFTLITALVALAGTWNLTSADAGARSASVQVELRAGPQTIHVEGVNVERVAFSGRARARLLARLGAPQCVPEAGNIILRWRTVGIDMGMYVPGQIGDRKPLGPCMTGFTTEVRVTKGQTNVETTYGLLRVGSPWTVLPARLRERAVRVPKFDSADGRAWAWSGTHQCWGNRLLPPRRWQPVMTVWVRLGRVGVISLKPDPFDIGAAGEHCDGSDEPWFQP